MQTSIPVAGQQFREFLRSELKVRSQKNESYSLRAFARLIGISPSGLSMVMGGKTPVTLNLIDKVSRRLKLTERDIQNFQVALLNEKTIIKGQLKDYQFVDGDVVAIILDWYHYAILNLMRTKDFKPAPSWIAKRLGLTLGEVQTAVEKLQKAQLLRIQGHKWVDLTNGFTTHTNNKKSSEAARLHQKQVFEKATEAIDNVDFRKRNHTGVTLAFRERDLEKAKEFISQFRKQFLETFDNDAEADEVYNLSVALFPFTKVKD